LWVRYNFSVGHKLVFDATPMIGGVFGNTTGVAPGNEASLSYKRMVLASSLLTWTATLRNAELADLKVNTYDLRQGDRFGHHQ